MSDARILKEAAAKGAADVREVSAPGMVSLKAALDAPDVAAALRDATGCAMPATRRMERAGDWRVLWMAPDEVLLLGPREEVGAVLATLGLALAALPHLAADVSDMRAVFRIEGGAAARETLAKLCPVDLAPGIFEPGEVRRTRLAQIAAAFWMEEGGFTLVCFRSVAQYAFDVLSEAAHADARVDYFVRA